MEKMKDGCADMAVHNSVLCADSGVDLIALGRSVVIFHICTRFWFFFPARFCC
jgi:hypothetical protein